MVAMAILIWLQKFDWRFWFDSGETSCNLNCFYLSFRHWNSVSMSFFSFGIIDHFLSWFRNYCVHSEWLSWTYSSFWCDLMLVSRPYVITSLTGMPCILAYATFCCSLPLSYGREAFRVRGAPRSVSVLSNCFSRVIKLLVIRVSCVGWFCMTKNKCCFWNLARCIVFIWRRFYSSNFSIFMWIHCSSKFGLWCWWLLKVFILCMLFFLNWVLACEVWLI